MSNRKNIKSQSESLTAKAGGKRRMLILTASLIVLLMASGVLGQWTGIFSNIQKTKPKAGELAPANFPPAGPAKEYVYVGNKLVATEEPPGPCTISMPTTSQSFTPTSGSGSVTVSAGNGCGWTAISNVAWLTITSGSGGSGNGAVQFSLTANTGAARSGAITVSSTSTSSQQVFTVYQGMAFTDVASSPFLTEIGKLSARSVTAGCSENPPLYCPGSTVTREQMAAFIIKSLGEFNPPMPPTQRFNDVPPANPFYKFIDRMAVLQITAGCNVSPPLYCPTNTITHQEMAAFIIKAMGVTNPPTPATQRFSDVLPSNPFYAFIDQMAERGIWGGRRLYQRQLLPRRSGNQRADGGHSGARLQPLGPNLANESKQTDRQMCKSPARKAIVTRSPAMNQQETGKQQRHDKRSTSIFSRLMQGRILAFTLAAFVCCAGVVMATRAFHSNPSQPFASNSAIEPQPDETNFQGAAAGRSKDHVSRAVLWSQLQQAFQLLGDRLERPGKERLTFTGTLERSGGSQSGSFPFRLVWELPGRLRLEESNGSQSRVFTFNGATLSKFGGSLQQQDYDELETLLYDSAEHFFVGRSQGQALLYLGGRFTESGDDETGPAYEIYQVADRIRTTVEGRQQIKHYYFNSDTQMLEKVRYKVERDGSTVAVEVQLSNWSPYLDQRFPARIVRLEDGKAVLTVSIQTVGISPKVEDGIFAAQSR